jgi:hypothetical protein
MAVYSQPIHALLCQGLYFLQRKEHLYLIIPAAVYTILPIYVVPGRLLARNRLRRKARLKYMSFQKSNYKM